MTASRGADNGSCSVLRSALSCAWVVFCACSGPKPTAFTLADAAVADTATVDSATADLAIVDVPLDISADSTATDANANDGTATDGEDAPESDGQTANDADATASPTTVWLHHPNAAELSLRGDTPPLSWEKDTLPLEVNGTAARFVLPEGKTFQIKALRKGEWALGNNHVVQSHEQRHVYPYFSAKTGAQRRENYDLPGPTGGQRTLRALLPPGYDENTLAHYPLLVMMDGQNLFEDATASFGVSWLLGDAVLKSMAAAKLGEIVVVGIDHAGAKRIFEYTPWPDQGDGGGGEAFLVWVDKTVLPDAAVRWRLLDDRSQRIIGGSSLGSLMALYALASRPQTWGGAICMSGAWWWDGLHMLTWLPTVWQTALPVRVWLDAGTVDDGLADTANMRKMLLNLGLLEPESLGYYAAQGAAHSESWWAQRVDMALVYLLDPGNLATPF